MIDRKIIPELTEMLNAVERMNKYLEALNSNFLDETNIVETQSEDEASAWLVAAEEDTWGARLCLESAIAALSREDQE